MEKDTIYTLISKYFDEGCTSDEVASILDWCNQSEENKKEFIQLKKAWVLSNKNYDNKIESSAPHVWANICKNLSNKPIKMYTKRSLIYYTSISAVAAVLLILVLNIFVEYGFKNQNIQYTDIYMPRGEKGQVTLPDGTKVWLNADSKLTFPNDFNSENRTVLLDGEAYFDVIKDEKHQFIVKTGSVDIKVHGTAFCVTAYPEERHIDVFLQRGSVSVYRSETEEELASLKPSQHISINKDSFIASVNNLDDNSEISWTFDELVFDHTPLREVLTKMGKWYGVNIIVTIPPSQQDLKYRFKIKSESLTEILELINKMTPIEYKIDGKEVTINYR